MQIYALERLKILEISGSILESHPPPTGRIAGDSATCSLLGREPGLRSAAERQSDCLIWRSAVRAALGEALFLKPKLKHSRWSRSKSDGGSIVDPDVCSPLSGFPARDQHQGQGVPAAREPGDDLRQNNDQSTETLWWRSEALACNGCQPPKSWQLGTARSNDISRLLHNKNNVRRVISFDDTY